MGGEVRNMVRRICKILIIIFIPVFFVSGYLNFFTLDFCSGSHTTPLCRFLSFWVVISFVLITEAQIFLFTDEVEYLQVCLAFWRFQIVILLSVLLIPELGMLLIFLDSSVWGVLSTFDGKISCLIFPAVCVLEIAHLEIKLWKFRKRKP